MKTTITNIADIQIGYQFRKKFEPVEGGGYPVIQIRDFDEDRILSHSGLLRFNIDKPDQFFVNKGDVLFLSRGYKNWAVPIDVDVQNTAAVNHFYILKLKDRNLLPAYLAWYINQAPSQEFLHINARQGTHMPLIPMSAFKGLTVEIPDMETQRKIVELSKLMEKEKKLLNQLQMKRSLFINEISLKAVKKEK